MLLHRFKRQQVDDSDSSAIADDHDSACCFGRHGVSRFWCTWSQISGREEMAWGLVARGDTKCTTAYVTVSRRRNILQTRPDASIPPVTSGRTVLRIGKH